MDVETKQQLEELLNQRIPYELIDMVRWIEKTKGLLTTILTEQKINQGERK